MLTNYSLDATDDGLAHAVHLAREAMDGGGVVLVPTDTIYGLMCLPTEDRAVRAIYEMKDRPADRRLPIIVADEEQASSALPLHWTRAAKALAETFWPGALTLACGVEPALADHWLAGRDEAAVRAPAHPLVQRLARELGPLLMTSANRHGSPTPTVVRSIVADLLTPPALVIDGGTLGGAASTLVNTNLPTPVVEREGAIPADAVASVLEYV